MVRLSWLAAGLALALAACGPAATTSSSSAPTAAPAELTPEQVATAMAALQPPYNTADYDAGKRVFAQCRSCHTAVAGAGNRVGPNLHGLFGRHVGREPGFQYSDALHNADFTWDGDHLNQWLQSPSAFLPGTRMYFIGVRDEQQRKNLIAYLMVETK